MTDLLSTSDVRAGAPAAVTTEQERQEFRLAIRRLLAERCPESEVRRLADDPLGYDPRLWRQLASELGLSGLLVPEEHGGQGMGLAELSVAMEEVGRALLPGPVLSCTVLAPVLVLATGDAAAAARLLPELAAGTLVIAVALGNGVTAREQAGGWRLDGTVNGVLDAHVADRLLVVASAGHGPGLFEVRRDAVQVESRRTLDLVTHSSTVVLDGTSAVRVGDDVRSALERVEDVAAVAAAAQLVGVGDVALRTAVDYALTREQFGRPIGSYQAVKHLCADMHARQECSRAAVASAVAADEGDLPRRASVAKAWTSPAAVRVVEDCIQVLGGIGFTWEHPAHLLLRRAKLLEALFGDARHHRARLAAQVGLQTTAS